MAAVAPVVEYMHERAEQKYQPGQIWDDMRCVFGQQKIGPRAKKEYAGNTGGCFPPNGPVFRLVIGVVIMVHSQAPKVGHGAGAAHWQ